MPEVTAVIITCRDWIFGVISRMAFCKAELRVRSKQNIKQKGKYFHNCSYFVIRISSTKVGIVVRTLLLGKISLAWQKS